MSRVRQPNGMETFLVTRFAEVSEALTDARLGKNPRHGAAMLAAGGAGMPREGGNLGGHLLASDPPEHTRLRKLLAREFTMRRVESMRPAVQRLADRLVDDIARDLTDGTGEVDLLPAYAVPLPIIVISGLLGIPQADQERFRAWTRAILQPLGSPGKADGVREFSAYLSDLMEAKRAHPGDDLFSALVAAEADDRLSPQELIGTAILLIVAGHETTVSLIANGVLALLRHPGQLEQVRARTELLPAAIEEFLRYDAPLDRATARWAVEDLEIAGTPVPKGAMVIAALGSANRDETVFPDPDRLDVNREHAHRHLAFGRGIHHCVGAPLARLEAETAIGTLLRRFPSIELAVPAEKLHWTPTIVMNSLDALPVRVSVR
ncbi:cytochrome P450 [Micromonospora endolithica]|uniref:Cytochrome P450 n=1 Tax=Micromonospora endolithica TaxID=230091 RepID=A0A3A9ZG66_9ACTN|nr:cytochrome P450 [Micromonospora endolithica]